LLNDGTVTTTAEVPTKPLLRGTLHQYAFFVAVVAGIVLTALAATLRTRPGATASVAIYSVTVCTLFGTSALYHRRVWSPRAYKVMRRLDHSMIFLFIAGTYTPFSVLLLPRTTAVVILAVVWGGAVVGIALKTVFLNAPRWVAAPLYIVLGWVAIAVLPQMLRTGGPAALLLLLAGGLFYTGGAVCFALRRPNPWPRVFGHHEIFHACTVIAAVCQQIALYFVLFG
jgi:hemolysin III